MIELSLDFQDLLVELADADADFVLVGGYAVAFHGHVRATKDIDVLIRGKKENADRVFAAMNAFGAPLTALGVEKDDLSTAGTVVQIGLPPNRIDIINQASGITYDEALKGAREFTLKGRKIKVIGLEALIKNKLAASRDMDILDVKALEKISNP